MGGQHVGRHRSSRINVATAHSALPLLLLLNAVRGLGALHHGAAPQPSLANQRPLLRGGEQAAVEGAILGRQQAHQVILASRSNASLGGSVAKPKHRITHLFGDAGQSDRESMEQSSLKCHETVKVHSGTNKWERCPRDCPLFEQDRADKDFCTFRCVDSDGCGQRSFKTQIPDFELGICRSCYLLGCKKCDTSVKEDRCAECQPGYTLHADGQCYFMYGGPWMYVVGGILGLLLVLVLLWVVDMAVRPAENQNTLDYAMVTREKTKLKRFDEQGRSKPIPLTTNMLRKNVAGPGMTLHFNFICALIIWPVIIAVIWMLFAAFIDSDLWRIGTRRFGTPRQNCILVAWGYERQRELMWTKVAFLWIVYLGTFFGSLAFAAYQLRVYRKLDLHNLTMKDCVAMVCGLPRIDGTKHVEVDLTAAIEKASGEKVVGASVCWDFKESASEVHDILNDELSEVMQERENIVVTSQEFNAVRRKLRALEKAIFCNDHRALEGPSKDMQITELLTGLHTSDTAFIVFETEEAQLRALRKLAGGFEFEDAEGVSLQALDEEPDTVQWDNFGHTDPSELMLKLVAGMGMILLACAFWAIVFYGPYAFYVLTFNYSNGREPGMVVSMTFSMIVVLGNVIMYEVCARISDWVGFKFKDSREGCYVILYLIACMLNVLLDLVTTYLVVERITEGLGFRTYFGTPLFRIEDFSYKFETYGMQRTLAENTFSYAWPSTFLIPFLIEPFVTITAPWFVGMLVVRNHGEIQGRNAEGWLEMAPHDLGRYADILLNMILGIILFYFPGGYTWSLFLAMSASHMYIYAFDHYKVLRQIPAKTYASYNIEWWCQAITAPIVGIIASCLVFKSNCQPGYHCLRSTGLIGVCVAVWFVHSAIHIIALVYLVPILAGRQPTKGGAESDEEENKYEDISRVCPCNYFTANPVFCLRSKYIYKHDPPCSYHVLGKEDLMQANKEIGCFYDPSRQRTFRRQKRSGLIT